MSAVGPSKQNGSRILAVIFDLDGTLVDSMPLVLQAFAHALAPFRPDLDRDGIFQRLGGPPARMMLELTGDESKAVEAMRRLEGFGFENGSLVQPFDGMRPWLMGLHARGFKLAVWTGRDRRTTQAILSAHELGAVFDVVVCGDDLSTHKPHPAGLIEILTRLDVRPEKALYAGDADADVLGGAEAGVRTVLISHGRQPGADVIGRAWCIVDTPAEAYARIEIEISSPA
jgi:phosphoglycolate phosphatase-like HAD superfamily hydrolase